MERYIQSNSEKNAKLTFSPNKISFKDNLNEEQLKVINNIKGPMIVIAGAGSGKTRIITYSVAKLLKSGILPSEIMLVTFTNKAAKEMLKRVERILGKKLLDIWGGTFHSIANIFLRKYISQTGLKPRYSIIDQSDSFSLMKLSIEDSFPHHKLLNLPNAKQCYKIHSYQINCNKSINQVLEWKYPQISIDLIPKLKKIFNKYSELKSDNNVVDFDDLLVLWNSLLDNKFIAQKIAEKIKYVLVDEYQDTNYLQAEIIFKIANLNKNIIVVGDDAQSIYGFRGANFRNLLNFSKNFKNVIRYNITFNYRSTPEILDLANDSIKHNEVQFQKKMNPIRKSHKMPKLIIVDNDEKQAKYVVNEILNWQEKGKSLSQIAILYRSNYHSLRLQRELQAKNIPFEVRSGVSFFEQAHIKDVLAHLKVIHNPYNQLAWNRLFSIIPGLGSINAKKILDAIGSFKDPLKKLTDINIFNTRLKEINISNKSKNIFIRYLKKIEKFNSDSKPSLIIEITSRLIINHLKKEFENYEDRLKDVNALRDFAFKFNSIREFLDDLNLIAPEISKNINILSEKENKMNSDRLILSTIHKAKGLEWDIVFIISLCESLFPSQKNSQNKSDIEEERRIFYVALTRTKDYLYLLTLKTILSYQGMNLLRPSRFIRELNDSFYELIDNSNKLYENYKVQLVEKGLKKKNKITEKRNYLPDFIRADKLIKNKD
ncbi:MAG: ATP-dependent helicase [Promethearchaeota archaeon]